MRGERSQNESSSENGTRNDSLARQPSVLGQQTRCASKEQKWGGLTHIGHFDLYFHYLETVRAYRLRGPREEDPPQMARKIERTRCLPLLT